MSTGDKKPTPQSSTTASPPAPAQQSPQPKPSKALQISRRTFLRAAVGASAVLASAPFATSGDFLTFATLGKEKTGPRVIANAVAFENDYLAEKNKPGSDPLTAFKWQVFYFPYPETVSVYYKNVLVRLPDSLVTNPGPTPSIDHYRAWNTTCVHLRCIVNPGVENGEDRLRCPCHGSQYRIIDGIPVAGPAYYLNLGRVPKVELELVGNDIVAKKLEGDPGIGVH